jgi:hypothetical protein
MVFEWVEKLKIEDHHRGTEFTEKHRRTFNAKSQRTPRFAK